MTLTQYYFTSENYTIGVLQNGSVVHYKNNDIDSKYCLMKSLTKRKR
jgi:hypothetical protein